MIPLKNTIINLLLLAYYPFLITYNPYEDQHKLVHNNDYFIYRMIDRAKQTLQESISFKISSIIFQYVANENRHYKRVKICNIFTSS